jgi:hypothetical protein
LTAVVGDDAVGHAEAAHQPLDELEGRPCDASARLRLQE